MSNIIDLHIQEEILPLFDFTLNDFSKETLIGILKKLLPSTEEILLRQEIFKGFIANINIFRDYSYSRVDFIEVYSFLGNYFNLTTLGNGLKVKLVLSEKARHQTRGKYIQFVLLLHKLQTLYLKRININPFPENYKIEINSLNNFLTCFNLTYYEELIREQRFSIKHIVELHKIISKKAKSAEIETFWKRYFIFEAYLSISKGIAKHRFTFPIFSETVFLINDLYHPLISQGVTNSFTTTNNVLLLTGPNMSGKSTFLKAVSLCVYLGHIGFAVPALKAEMPFFNYISISINHNDNLLSGYSHFMTEVMNLKKVVMEAIKDKKCFAVFDELFRGTNIEDALEISTTTIKGLTKFNKSFFFISTHMQQLNQIEEVKKEIISTYYIDCKLNNNSPVFTYQLKKGWSDLKVGSILFENEGLNEMLNLKKQ